MTMHRSTTTDGGIEVDRGIKVFIEALRDHGFETAFSCSGLATDHVEGWKVRPSLALKISNGLPTDSHPRDYGYNLENTFELDSVPDEFPHSNDEYVSDLLQVASNTSIESFSWFFSRGKPRWDNHLNAWDEILVFRFPVEDDYEIRVGGLEDRALKVRDDVAMMKRWERFTDEMLNIPPETLPEFTD